MLWLVVIYFIGKRLYSEYESRQKLKEMSMLRYDDPRLLDDIKGIKWPDDNPKGHDRSTFFYPLMAQGQPFIFTCWVSFDDGTSHWNKVYSGSLQREDIVWSEMKWDLTFERDKKNER